MAQPLHLTTDEQKVFGKLPEALREGWKVETETLTFRDDESRRRTRFELMHITSPVLKKFQEQTKAVKTNAEFLALVENTDFTKLKGQDLVEIIFAMGPDGLTMMVEHFLSSVSSDDDLEKVSDLTRARHELLESLQNFSS